MVHLSGIQFKQATLAHEVLARCALLAGYSEDPGRITRTFLCAPMHGAHACLGSLAVCGRFDAALLERTDAAGISLATAVRNFGLDPAQLHAAAYSAGKVLGYLEAHIEQGPILDMQNLPLGVVKRLSARAGC